MADLTALEDVMRVRAAELVNQAGTSALQAVTDATPRSDGPGPHLADSWKADYFDTANGSGVTISNDHREETGGVDPDWIENGTVEHDFGPRTATVLHWVDAEGNDVFAMHVHKPAKDGVHMMALTLTAENWRNWLTEAVS